MGLKRIEYFVHVAEAGSLTKAATVLGIVQPALSRQIRLLEKELGVALFLRTGRGLILTEAGEELLLRSRMLITDLERMREDIRGMAKEPTGNVALGVPPTVSPVLVPPLVRHFSSNYPRISLEVVEALSGHIHEWLSKGRLDVGVLYDAGRTRKLFGEQLLFEELFLICPPGGEYAIAEPLPVAALKDIPLILPRPLHGLRRRVEEALKQYGERPSIVHQVDAMNATKEAVAQGVGYTVLPSVAVHQEVEAGRLILRKLVDPPLRRNLLLVTSTQRPISQSARTLCSAIKKEVAELVRCGIWVDAT